MSSEDKKASWARFRESHKRKVAEANRPAPKHPSDHKEDPNPGGYCRKCGFGRDHS